jgi:hypothetical protein
MVCWTGFMVRLRQEYAKHSRKAAEVRDFSILPSRRTLIVPSRNGGKARCTRAWGVYHFFWLDTLLVPKHPPDAPHRRYRSLFLDPVYRDQLT